MSAKDVCLWISIISAIATGAAKYSSLEEARANQERALVDVRGYLTAAEGRIDALEKDRALLERIHALEMEVRTIEERTRRR